MTISVVLASCRPAAMLTAAVNRLRPQCLRAGADLIIARPLEASAPEPVAGPEGCRVVRCQPAATIPEIRGTGLAAATEDVVLLTEDNCLVGENWVERIVAGFTPEVDVVGGAMGNARRERPIDAGACLAEYGFYGPLQQPSATPSIACANVAYRRRVLSDVASWSLAGAWEDEIHGRLARQGKRFRLDPGAVVEQNLEHQLGAFCRNRYEHGRDYAMLRSAHLTTVKRLLLASATPLLPAVLTWRVWQRAGRATPDDFFRALPFILTFFGAWASGEAAGYLHRRAPP